ncbi:MAG: mechanosensitive ion channel [Acidimicrobiia bacterium]|nr:mechanosensitive ion channel [Acidimicrobiia bacterium]
MSDTTLKLVISGAVVVGLVIVRWLVLRAVHRYVEDPDVWFRTRRIATYATTAIALITLAWIWLEAFDDLPTYLGLVSAGIAIALADLLKNMVGWVYIMARRPLRLGDRIEVAGTQGDVVDIRLFRFSLLEIGNWVHADQSTGRLIHVPNGILFTTEVANYTEGFEYIWHEIPVLITFESDWRSAKAILREAIDAAVPDPRRQATEHLLKTAQEYQIKIGTMTPIVYLTVKDSGVLLTGRMMVPVRERRGIEERVWGTVLARFAAEPDIDLAYPTVRTYYAGPVEIDTSPSVSPPGGDAE